MFAGDGDTDETLPPLHIAANAALALIMGAVAWFAGVQLGGHGLTELSVVLTTVMDGTESTVVVAQYYGGFMIVAGIVAGVSLGVVHKWGGGVPEPEYYELLRDNRRFRLGFPLIVTVVGSLEEVVFRATPLLAAAYVWGNEVVAVVLGSVVWLFLHERAQWPVTMIIGVLFIQLWLAGLWVEAIVIHGVHNLVVGLLTTVWYEVSE